MKVTDDYLAKIKLWAANPKVVALPPGPPIPKFRSRKFSNYEEFNAWKKELILQIAREHRDDGRDNPPV